MTTKPTAKKKTPQVCHFCKARCNGNLGLIHHIRFKHKPEYAAMLKIQDQHPEKKWPQFAMFHASGEMVRTAGVKSPRGVKSITRWTSADDPPQSLTDFAKSLVNGFPAKSDSMLRDLTDTLREEIKADGEALSEKNRKLTVLEALLNPAATIES